VRTTSRSSPRRYDAILCRRSLRTRVHVRQGELVGPRCLETLFSAMVAARAAARNHYSNRSLYTVADSVRGFCSVRSPQVRSLVSGKPNFAARDRRRKNDGVHRTPLRQRPKLIVVRHCGELVCLVFDKVSWSDTPAFHNTLVVGSSPTSSPTQSRVFPLENLRSFRLAVHRTGNRHVMLQVSR